MQSSPPLPHLDVVIAGEINLDLILYGLPEQMPIERELLASGFIATLGSSSAILAHNLAALGARVGFICRAGQDDFGRIALQRLAESGVATDRTQFDPVLPTGVTVLLTHGNGRHILTYPGPMTEMRVSDLDLDYLLSARHFHLSSLFLQKALHPGLPQLFRTLRGAGLTLSLDTNDDPEDLWAGVLPELLDLVDILLPNEDELLRMTGRATVNAALDLLAPRVPLIAVKCGARGAIVQQGNHRELIPPVMVQPIDTIGAGDSFNAGFLRAWLAGEPPARAATLANLTGALSTQRPGGTEAFRDRALTRSFLREYCAAQPDGSPLAKLGLPR
jgi:sugar/nucleoside kinase (ribokinase family)